MTNAEKNQVARANAAKLQEAVIDTADEVGGRVRRAYSGRCMYGRECMGIVHDDVNETIECGARHGLRGARADNMGLQFIIYWPNVPAMDAGGDDE